MEKFIKKSKDRLKKVNAEFKEVCNILKNEGTTISRYNWVVVCNDSNIGPLFSISIDEETGKCTCEDTSFPTIFDKEIADEIASGAYLEMMSGEKLSFFKMLKYDFYRLRRNYLNKQINAIKASIKDLES